jgi:hypothetical protein
MNSRWVSDRAPSPATNAANATTTSMSLLSDLCTIILVLRAGTPHPTSALPVSSAPPSPSSYARATGRPWSERHGERRPAPLAPTELAAHSCIPGKPAPRCHASLQQDAANILTVLKVIVRCISAPPRRNAHRLSAELRRIPSALCAERCQTSGLLVHPLFARKTSHSPAACRECSLSRAAVVKDAASPAPIPAAHAGGACLAAISAASSSVPFLRTSPLAASCRVLRHRPGRGYAGRDHHLALPPFGDGSGLLKAVFAEINRGTL